MRIPDALRIHERFLKYMSIGLNNVLNTLNPGLIVINSSFTTYFPDITKTLEKSLNNRMGPSFKDPPVTSAGHRHSSGRHLCRPKEFSGGGKPQAEACRP